MICCMIEYGFVGYLKKPWNCFDGAMVLIGYTDLLRFGGNSSRTGASSVKALRALRALRPLRTITRFQSLRSVVVCFLEVINFNFKLTLILNIYILIIKALPLLVSVVSLLFFFLFLFALAGLLMFYDVYHYACYSPIYGIEIAMGNSPDEMGCSQFRSCPENYYCKVILIDLFIIL